VITPKIAVFEDGGDLGVASRRERVRSPRGPPGGRPWATVHSKDLGLVSAATIGVVLDVRLEHLPLADDALHGPSFVTMIPWDYRSRTSIRR